MPTPISLSGTPFLEPRQSPSESHHDLQYRDIVDSATHHGLGISGPTTTNYVQPGIFTYDHPHREALDNHFSPESQVQGFGLRPLDGPSQPNTPVTRRKPGRDHHVPIAPNPDGLRKMHCDKKRRQVAEVSLRRGSATRRNSGQKSKSSQMERENDAVQLMRTQRNLSWREIVIRINAQFGTNYSASCLQMRMTRMKHRAQQWPEEDVSMCPLSTSFPTYASLIIFYRSERFSKHMNSGNRQSLRSYHRRFVPTMKLVIRDFMVHSYFHLLFFSLFPLLIFFSIYCRCKNSEQECFQRLNAN